MSAETFDAAVRPEGRSKWREPVGPLEAIDPVAEVAARPGISKYSLYEWRKRYGKPADTARDDEQAAELRRLLRVTEERDILKNAAA